MTITFRPIGVIHTKASEAEVKEKGDREREVLRREKIGSITTKDTKSTKGS